MLYFDADVNLSKAFHNMKYGSTNKDSRNHSGRRICTG